MRKVVIFVIGIGVVLTFIVFGAVQIGHVTARSEATEQLTAFKQFVVEKGNTLSQGSLDDVVAVLHSDLPTASANNFPGYYSTGFGYGFRFPSHGTGAYGIGGTAQTLCSVNWLHGDGPFTWEGFAAVNQGDCETNEPVTRLLLSLDSGSTQTLNVGDLIEAFGAPIAAERPSFRSCFNRFRYSANVTGAPGSSVNLYIAAPNFYAPSLQLYFENGLSAMVPCYAGAQTTLNLEAPVRAITYAAPLPTPSSVPFSYSAAQWHGLAVPSLYYAMCNASDDPRCQGRRLLRGGQNGFFYPPGGLPPSIFPTFVLPGP
ncbi:MAG: hypothetical protein ACYDBJ_07705 [Aggregatilineales bacterium]